MKQLLLIMMIAGSALTVSAQDLSHKDRNDLYHYKDNRVDRKDLNGRHDKNMRNRREMKKQVAVINRDYDTRINYIKGNPRMRRNEKSRQIEQLEMQRRIALNQCRDSFSGKKHRDFVDGKKW